MTAQTISITRALVELKKSDDRINQAINSGLFVSALIGKDTKQKCVIGNLSVAEVTSKIQASYDKVNSLLATREELKSKIVMSNALTKVTVLGREMTVAEAIELKSTVNFRSNLLNTLRSQLTSNKGIVEKNNAQLEAAIDVSLNQLYGSEKSKIDEASLKAIGEVQRNQKEYSLFDPQNIEAKIEKLTKEIEDITSEIDFILSESNARTVITVEM